MDIQYGDGAFATVDDFFQRGDSNSHAWIEDNDGKSETERKKMTV